MVIGIVATHGNLAAELIATAREVYSDVSHCHAISNSRLTPQGLRDELESIIASGEADDHYILFVDFFGGSCCHACMAVEMTHPRVKLITGVNLPMFLAFLYKRKELGFEELVAELLVRGKDSVKLVTARED